jgi:hypothetical protein
MRRRGTEKGRSWRRRRQLQSRLRLMLLLNMRRKCSKGCRSREGRGCDCGWRSRTCRALHFFQLPEIKADKLVIFLNCAVNFEFN